MTDKDVRVLRIRLRPRSEQEPLALLRMVQEALKPSVVEIDIQCGQEPQHDELIVDEQAETELRVDLAAVLDEANERYERQLQRATPPEKQPNDIIATKRAAAIALNRLSLAGRVKSMALTLLNVVVYQVTKAGIDSTKGP